MPLENPHQNRPEEPKEPEEYPKPQVAPGTRHIGRPAGVGLRTREGRQALSCRMWELLWQFSHSHMLVANPIARS